MRTRPLNPRVVSLTHEEDVAWVRVVRTLQMTRPQWVAAARVRRVVRAWLGREPMAWRDGQWVRLVWRVG